MVIDSKLEVIAHMSTFFYRKVGLKVSKQVNDKNSNVSTLSDGTIVSVVKLDDQDKEFLCSVLEKGEKSLAAYVSYDRFFKNVKLPIEETQLDHLYDGINEGDEENTYLGYLFKKFSNSREIEEIIKSKESNIDHDKWEEFYSKVLIPSFLKYQKTNKIDLTKDDTKNFIKESNPKIGDHPIFPEVPSNLDDGSTSSSRLPEEVPKFDDEYQMQNPPSQTMGPSSSGLAPIGDRDLHPFGKYPPMRPDIGPDSTPHSGMIPDKNHPLFQNPGGFGGFGSRGDHPPGSRYDDPMGGDDFDAVGRGLPGGMGLGRGGRRGDSGGPFGGNGSNPFGGFSGGFI